MSFSYDVKNTISTLFPDGKAEADSELMGMVMYAKKASRDSIIFATDVASVSDVFSGLILATFDISAVPQIISMGEEKYQYKTLLSPDESRMVFNYFWHDGNMRIRPSMVKSDKQKSAFVRGAFMSCGYVNPPEKNYSIEFRFDNADIAVDFATFMADLFEMPKLTVRKGDQVAYYRSGNIVGDILSYIGAKSEAFAVMNTQAYKSIRNEQNRQTNFEVANISKQTSSSIEQIEAIEWLIKNKKFNKLSPQLRMTSKLRLNNPDLPLSELASLETPPVSKSQESKRLKQIVEFRKIIETKQ